jgi:RNA recognition motif-containing protein
VDNNKLKSFIEQQGLRSIDVFVPFDQDRKSKGFGYARFSDEQTAKEAMRKLNGARLEGKSLRIDFSNGKK